MKRRQEKTGEKGKETNIRQRLSTMNKSKIAKKVQYFLWTLYLYLMINLWIGYACYVHLYSNKVIVSFSDNLFLLPIKMFKCMFLEELIFVFCHVLQLFPWQKFLHFSSLLPSELMLFLLGSILCIINVNK